ncbi:conserved hypothetical protein [Ricinus communis]|uniref:Uncharacterized protein n=1 Tax=Ricinus communis TaxID=3988 RepID=B9T9W1_RICCO|nr:conserved hypothetical protein [Ricinus communis]
MRAEPIRLYIAAARAPPESGAHEEEVSPPGGHPAHGAFCDEVIDLGMSVTAIVDELRASDSMSTGSLWWRPISRRAAVASPRTIASARRAAAVPMLGGCDAVLLVACRRCAPQCDTAHRYAQALQS